MPEAAHRVESPYKVEARYATRGGTSWVGYKVHLTELRRRDDAPDHERPHHSAATATDV